MAGQPASVTISSVAATSAWVSVTPPAGGCLPVSYELAHARINTLDSQSLTTVPAGQSIAARLGNLQTGVTYSVTAVGICADGTRTPPSAPVRFTTVAATGGPPSDEKFVWLVANFGPNRNGTTVSVCIDAGMTQCTLSTGAGTFAGPLDILNVGDVTLVSNYNAGAGNTVSVCDRLLTNCTTACPGDSLFGPAGMALGPNNKIYIANEQATTESITICSDVTLKSCTTSTGDTLARPFVQVVSVDGTTYIGKRLGQACVPLSPCNLSSAACRPSDPSPYSLPLLQATMRMRTM
jgi:hypothetical protein